MISSQRRFALSALPPLAQLVGNLDVHSLGHGRASALIRWLSSQPGTRFAGILPTA